MSDKKFDTVFAVNEIIANAGTLLTLLDCIQAESAISPVKREMLGDYATFYEGEAQRVDNLLHAAGKLLWEIDELGNGIYSALCAAEKEVTS